MNVFLSILIFGFLAWLLSKDKKKINWKVVCLGFFWQIIFAIILLKMPMITSAFSYINLGLKSINDATTFAMKFVFGGLATPSHQSGLGFILALHGFPVLIVIAALSALLTYLKILPAIINGMSFFFRRIFSIGGTLGIAVSANIFTGISETPLVIRPYLKKLSHSELFSLMVCGTSCVAASVMVLYDIILKPIEDNSIRHIISAVLISIPGALAISRIIVPETKKLTEGDDADFSRFKSALDAISGGIIDGAKVAINVIAMLIGFVALVEVFNQLLSLLPLVDGQEITMQKILGFLLAPIMWIIGLPPHEIYTAGSLLGTKIILNEIIAFQQLVTVAAELSHKSQLIMIYALCSFANLGSIGVMIGVYNALIPERKQEVIALSMKSIVAGTFANFITASIVGMLL